MPRAIDVLSLRRPSHETRIEIMPLIDVIFLLLTFFIYAMTMMIRAEILPVDLHPLGSGTPAPVVPAVSITIDRNGDLFYNREPVALELLEKRLDDARIESSDLVVYVAAEARGDLDRLPVFLDLYDTLANLGLDIRLVGAPKDDTEAVPMPKPTAGTP